MSTAVISGRIDKDIKVRADAIIRAAGSSVNSVISTVWHNIVETGELPVSSEGKDAQDTQRQTFESFMEWFETLPPQNKMYAHMTDDEILSLKVDEYV